MRAPVTALALMLLASAQPPEALACLACTTTNWCYVVGYPGNAMCTGNGLVCSQGFPCRLLKSWGDFGARPTAVSMTLHPAGAKDVAVVDPGVTRHVWHGQAPLDGASARRALAAALGEPSLAAEAQGVEFMVAASGFAVRLDDGGGAGLSVAAGGEPGAMRARIGAANVAARARVESLADGEVLVSRATLGGRDWWVVAQVTSLPIDPEAQKDRLRELQQALYRDSRVTVGRRAPRLELSPDLE